MDAKRILILVVLVVLLGFVGQRAWKYYRLYNPAPTAAPAPGPTPAGGAAQPAK